MSVTDTAATAYETASLAATAEVFGNTTRWQKLVGCAPKADLSDACVTTYIKTFGRAAFRRDLTDDEVQQWLGVAKNARDAGEHRRVRAGGRRRPDCFNRRTSSIGSRPTRLDSSNGRLKYDGPSMATSPLVLADRRATQRGSAGCRSIGSARHRRRRPRRRCALARECRHRRSHDCVLQRVRPGSASVGGVKRAPTLFPTFDAALKSSMLQATQLFLKNIVLAPNADVRSFYDSNQTFVDAKLAPLYGVQGARVRFWPGSAPGKQRTRRHLGPSRPDRGANPNPTAPPRPDEGSSSWRASSARRRRRLRRASTYDLPVDPTLTCASTSWRRIALIRPALDATRCSIPLGIALEHFDPIGQYRDNRKRVGH